MTPADIDRVFGRSRLRMVTGDHVEVFREASLPGERRRYTKRFLATPEGDFREWTEREWRILARLVGHGIKPVPDVVQFDRGAADRAALVQTFDAGVTVDHWATLLPLERDGVLLRNVFEDSAHWWSLARHSLIALDAIHELHLVHLDLKADNICIPVGPADFDPFGGGRSLHPRFEDITLIDFAFSLISGERLKSALPIAAQLDYEYQSPRLLLALEAGRQGDLGPTRQLDWRCDLFSLAAMLWRYLPELESTADRAWTPTRHAKASALVRRLIETHDSELPATRPHAELIALASEPLTQPDLRHSLQRGWTLAIDTTSAARAAPTPITRIALPLAAPVTPVAQQESSLPFEHEPISVDKSDVDFKAIAHGRRDQRRRRKLWWGAGATAAALAGLALAARTLLAPPAELTAADVHSARVDVAPPAVATTPSSPSTQAKPKPAAVVVAASSVAA
jgi:serine/threonine protein kinase